MKDRTWWGLLGEYSCKLVLALTLGACIGLFGYIYGGMTGEGINFVFGLDLVRASRVTGIVIGYPVGFLCGWFFVDRVIKTWSA